MRSGRWRIVWKKKKARKTKLVLFSDEDKCDGAASRFYEPKPSWILTGIAFDQQLYLSFYGDRNGILKELSAQRFDGAQDYDLVLRAYAAGGQFVHVPKVLYHWRCHEASTASNPQSKLRLRGGAACAGRLLSSKRLEGDSERAETSWLLSEDYEDSVFCQRPEIGIWAKPLPGGRDILASGIRRLPGERTV
ncbi:MAG: hypothetical protein ACLURV_00460 [Gallintestinimicrobium sp.]